MPGEGNFQWVYPEEDRSQVNFCGEIYSMTLIVEKETHET